jgi:hypothetical protein
MEQPNFRPKIFGGLAAMLFGATNQARLGLRERPVRTGPGRVTVLTHENYIRDPRRKWYGLGGRRP